MFEMANQPNQSFERDAARLLPKLSNQAKLFLDAYCDGVR